MDEVEVTLADVVGALRQMDANAQQGFAAMVAALKGVQVAAERNHVEIIRELRIVNNSIRNMDNGHSIRLDGMDEKLSEIADYGKQLLDRGLNG